MPGMKKNDIVGGCSNFAGLACQLLKFPMGCIAAQLEPRMRRAGRSGSSLLWAAAGRRSCCVLGLLLSQPHSQVPAAAPELVRNPPMLTCQAALPPRCRARVHGHRWVP